MLGPRVRSVSHQVKDIKISFRWCGKLLSKWVVSKVKRKPNRMAPNGLLVGCIICSGMDGWMVEFSDSNL